MQKWEYNHYCGQPLPKPALDGMGDNGWELTAIYMTTDLPSFVHFPVPVPAFNYIFKRPVQENIHAHGNITIGYMTITTPIELTGDQIFDMEQSGWKLSEASMKSDNGYFYCFRRKD